jgi:glycine/D-amino acid oxidase-like deaminating enzyme
MHLSFAGGDYDIGLGVLSDLRWFWPALHHSHGAVTVHYLAAVRRLLPRRAAVAIADLVADRNDPVPSAAKAWAAFDEFSALFAGLGGLQILGIWAGNIESTPDLIPAIGPVAGVSGLLMASGFSGHGFGPGPMVGRILADLLAGRPTPALLAQLAPDRFATGKWAPHPEME